MQRQTAEMQPSFVLHARKFRETSLLVEFFTHRFGRVGVVARGARSGKYAHGALLQPFSLVKISWVARGDLGTLTAVEREVAPNRLQGRALACGFYLNELLIRLLTRHDPHPQLFECYEVTLQSIVDHDQQTHALRLFERRLLDEIGYGLILDHDVSSGAAIQADIRYDYHPEVGPMASATEGDGRISVSGATLIAMDHGKAMSVEQLREARFLLQKVLSRYLGEKPLKSRELLHVQHNQKKTGRPSGPGNSEG
ncbi:MAG: DNA repair protein RecO [Proteobacteria bacterium]|nr:MAG: DNA repair protein RecO [Pseudomonadota bacterium]QKK12262.1 MAG: DNA repair protein RecO [Pseudomonadota bacterium]